MYAVDPVTSHIKERRVVVSSTRTQMYQGGAAFIMVCSQCEHFHCVVEPSHQHQRFHHDACWKSKETMKLFLFVAHTLFTVIVRGVINRGGVGSIDEFLKLSMGREALNHAICL